jgi:hypothetical protein
MVMRFLRMVTEIGTSESPQGRLYEANLLRATSSAFSCALHVSNLTVSTSLTRDAGQTPR